MIRESYENQIKERVRENAEESAAASAVDGTGHSGPRTVSRSRRGWERFLTDDERSQIEDYERNIAALTQERRVLARTRRRHAERAETDMVQRLDDKIKTLDRSRRASAAERKAIVNRCTKRRRRKETEGDV